MYFQKYHFNIYEFDHLAIIVYFSSFSCSCQYKSTWGNYPWSCCRRSSNPVDSSLSMNTSCTSYCVIGYSYSRTNTYNSCRHIVLLSHSTTGKGGTTLNQTRIEIHTTWVMFKGVFLIPMQHFVGHVAYQCFQ